ncbi:uncharacterized protein LOC114574497 [Exaiptasia diaphana]|uniref:Uncharacterized protein n=1 Tax=Exaiptasia diaphana TaxID=2652724 RepID=A0A913YET3_EXADI|nr:uncharacterized protein LOC114574497 [Exaiptasia diaphana]
MKYDALATSSLLDLVLRTAENDFTNKDIALMLGVSKRTIENRMREYELTNTSRYSDIHDDILDAHVQRILTNFPRSGVILFYIPKFKKGLVTSHKLDTGALEAMKNQTGKERAHVKLLSLSLFELIITK